MKNKKLINKLKDMRKVTVNRFWIAKMIHERMDHIRVVNKRCDPYYRDDDIDLNNIDTWSTFDQCVKSTFEIFDDGFLTCLISIHDGDNMSGEPVDIRFSAILKIPIGFIARDQQRCR